MNRYRRRLLPITLVLAALSLGGMAQGQAAWFDETGRDHHRDIELLIDATPLLIESARRHRTDRERPSDDGPSICHQADKTTWSTRTQPCPDPKPVERQKVWSTSSP